MYQLPDPQRTRPAGQPTARDAAIGEAADEMLAALNDAIQRGRQTPTAVRVDDPSIPSYEDGPRTGDAPPVWQDDKRIVPEWALGLAVGSIGVGAGVTGIGCGIWLACKGLSSVIHSLSTVTLAGVLTVTLPFAGLAMAATAIGGAISRAKKAATPEVHNHNGTEYHEHNVDARRSVWSKTVNKH
jgi:hypothetical protein